MKTLPVVLTLAVASTSAVQERTPEGSKQASAITVEGCVRGSALQALPGKNGSKILAPLTASEFTLMGARDLLQAIREHHEGHHIAVTGVLKEPPRPANVKTKVETIDLGRGGRITVATGQRTGKIVADPVAIGLVVSSFEHIASNCSIH